jgi:hypothetical protein
MPATYTALGEVPPRVLAFVERIGGVASGAMCVHSLPLVVVGSANWTRTSIFRLSVGRPILAARSALGSPGYI